MISVALLLYPGVRLALSECKVQCWSYLDELSSFIGFICTHARFHGTEEAAIC